MSDSDPYEVHRVRKQELLQALTARPDCTVLVELLSLRDQGWESEALNEHFTQQRTTNETDRSPEVDQKWLNIMCNSLRQMDKSARFVQRTERFIDIGCCPGGYSTYIMQTCPNATGIGISLPYEQGGHGLAISSELLSRIQVHISDLAQFDLAPVIPKPNSTLASALATIPFRPHTFDLVVCDGHHLRLNPDNADRPWNWNRLLVSQLLLGLRAVSSGGTLFLKLSHPEKPMGARILLALCRIAHPVRTIKPTMHATRGTLYVIAQHIRLDTEEYHALERALEKLWYTMSFEGENGYGREISSEEEDTITSWEDVMSTEGQNNVVRLSAKVWHIQRNALSKLLRSRSVSNHQG